MGRKPKRPAKDPVKGAINAPNVKDQVRAHLKGKKRLPTSGPTHKLKPGETPPDCF